MDLNQFLKNFKSKINNALISYFSCPNEFKNMQLFTQYINENYKAYDFNLLNNIDIKVFSNTYDFYKLENYNYSVEYRGFLNKNKKTSILTYLNECGNKYNNFYYLNDPINFIQNKLNLWNLNENSFIIKFENKNNFINFLENYLK